MRQVVTPRQVARAIQVSESSIKRWCDKGIIPTQFTAGGHRRIPMSGLFKFLRSGKQVLVRPELLGLPATTGQSNRVIDRASRHLTEALLQRDEEQARQVVLDLYLAEHSLSAICDQVIAKAFAEIGERWESGEAEIYQERLSCGLALKIVHELRLLVPAPSQNAPLAIGGAVAGDTYSLATAMVELALRDAKWDAVSLGDNLPFETLNAAIKEHRPRIFWLSVSHLQDASRFIQQYSELYDEFGFDVAFVVGGRALSEEIRQHMKYAAYCDKLQHLEAFAQTLQSS